MIYYKKDTDNIVTLTLDMKGRPMNVINHEIFEAFVPVLEQLKVDKKRGALRGGDFDLWEKNLPGWW